MKSVNLIFIRNFSIVVFALFMVWGTKDAKGQNLTYPEYVVYSEERAIELHNEALGDYNQERYYDAIQKWAEILYSYERARSFDNLIICLRNIGYAYEKLEQPGLALHYQMLAEKAAIQYRTLPKLPSIYEQIGDYLKSFGFSSEAISYYKKGLEIALELADSSSIQIFNDKIEAEQQILYTYQSLESTFNSSLAEAKTDEEKLKVYRDFAEINIGLGKYDSAEKYLDAGMKFSFRVNDNTLVGDLYRMYVNFNTAMKILDKKFTLVPSFTLNDKSAIEGGFFILTLKNITRDSLVVLIDGGKNDGVIPGSTGNVTGLHVTGLSEHQSYFVGRSKVLEVYDNTSLVSIKIKDTTRAEKNVFILDLVGVKIYPNNLNDNSLILRNALVKIYYNGDGTTPLYDSRMLQLYADGKFEERLLNLMRGTINEMGKNLQEYTQKDDRWTTKITSGYFAGKNMIEAMMTTDSPGILAYFSYVLTYPAKYLGVNWDLNETFATWVLNGSDITKDFFKILLDDIKTDAELITLTKKYKDFIIANNILYDLASEADIMGDNGQTDEAMKLIKQCELMAGIVSSNKLSAQVYFKMGSIYRTVMNYPQAIESYKKASEFYKMINDSSNMAECNHNIGLSFQDMKNYSESVSYFEKSIAYKKEQAWKLKSEWGYETMASTLWGLAYSYRYLEKYQQSLELYQLSAAYYDSSSSADAVANKITVLKNIGEIYEVTGQNKKAIELYLETLELAVKTDNKKRQADLNNNIAFNYFELGDYATAIEYYRKGFSISMERNDLKTAGFSKSNIGQAYWNIGDYVKAIQAHEEAIALREKANDIEGLGFSWNKIGGLYKDSGEPLKAIDAYDRSTKYYEEIGDTSGLAETYLNIGDLYYNVKDYPKAIEYYQKSFVKRELKREVFKMADLYFNLGLVYYDAIQYEKANEYWQKAYNLQKEIGDKNGIIYTMANLGLYEFVIKKDYDKGEKYFTDAVQLSKELENKNNIAYCFNRFANLYTDKGELDKAKKYLDSSLALYREVGDRSRTGNVLVNIGYYFASRGEFDSTKAYFEEAYQISIETNNFLLRGSTLGALGELQQMIGNYQLAKVFLDSMMTQYKEAGNIWGLASSHLLLGNYYNTIGEYANAFYHYEITDSIYASLNDELSRATPMNNMGTIYFWQGNYDESLKKFYNALTILDKLGFKNEFYGIVKSNIGEVLFYQKKYNEAKKWLDEALKIALELNAVRQLVTIYNLLGKMEMENNNFPAAKSALEQALTYVRKTGERDRIAEVLSNLGKLYYRQQMYDKAIPYLSESITISREIGSTRFLYQPLSTLGYLLSETKQIDSSIAYLKQAIDVVEQIRSKIVGGDKAQKLFSSGEEKSKIYETIISLFIQKGEIDSALQYLERSNNEALKQQFGKMEINFSDEEKNIALKTEKDLKKKVDGIDQELAKEKSKPDALQNKEKIQSLEKSKSVAEKEYINFITETVKKDSNLSKYFSGNVNPKSFIRTKGKIPSDVAVLAYLMGENQLYIFVATRDTVAAKVVQVKKADLEKKVVKLYRNLKDASIPNSVGTIDPVTFMPMMKDKEMEYESQILPFIKNASELYHTLIDPVSEFLTNKTQLSIIPYGKLYYLPFEVLVKEKDEKFVEFLGKEYSVFYISTLDIFSGQQSQQPKTMRVMALGNADKTLPKSEIEVKDIKNIFGDAAVYLRDEATEDKVKTISGEFNALHLATHGNLDYTDIRSSYLTLASNTVSGEDGKLTIEEVWSLSNLYDFNLVTLSACKTAVSDEIVTGWMVNPANAFFDVGVKTVVASLWQVDDEATSILMKEFYNNLKTMTKSSALNKAKMKLSQNPKYSYPYFWAAFVLVGDFN